MHGCSLPSEGFCALCQPRLQLLSPGHPGTLTTSLLGCQLPAGGLYGEGFTGSFEVVTGIPPGAQFQASGGKLEGALRSREVVLVPQDLAAARQLQHVPSAVVDGHDGSPRIHMQVACHGPAIQGSWAPDEVGLAWACADRCAGDCACTGASLVNSSCGWHAWSQTGGLNRAAAYRAAGSWSS